MREEDDWQFSVKVPSTYFYFIGHGHQKRAFMPFPRRHGTYEITTATATATQKVLVSPLYLAPTSKPLDPMAWEECQEAGLTATVTVNRGEPRRCDPLERRCAGASPL